MQEIGRHLEKAKCKLALAVDFNLGDLFRFFSSEGQAVDASDIARVVRYLRVNPSSSKEDSSHLISQFLRSLDGDGDGKLLFTDLSRAFLSAGNEEYQRLVIDRPTFYDSATRIEQIFSLQTQALIGDVLKMHLYMERKQGDMLRQVEVIDGGIFKQDASFMGNLLSVLNSTKGHISFLD